MELNDFKIGDILLIHSRFKRSGGIMEEVRAARVTHLNFNDLGLVTFEGFYRVDGYLPSGQGAFDPNRIGRKYYGYFKVDIIGYVPPTTHWYPSPGDVGYDLMC